MTGYSVNALRELTFDRTYEGLKPDLFGMEYADDITFDRTYEGLKRRWRMPQLTELNGYF